MLSAKPGSSSTAASLYSPNHEPSHPGSDYCSARTGSSIPSLPSVVQNTCCAISAPTPTVSPSPTTGCLPSQRVTSHSGGETPPTATVSASCPCRSASSCAASYFIYYRAVSCASATSASSLTGGERSSTLFPSSQAIRSTPSTPRPAV